MENKENTFLESISSVPSNLINPKDKAAMLFPFCRRENWSLTCSSPHKQQGKGKGRKTKSL